MTRLAQVVQEALDILEWSDDIDDDEASGKSQLATDALISGQPCDIFIETHEQQDDIRAVSILKCNDRIQELDFS